MIVEVEKLKTDLEVLRKDNQALHQKYKYFYIIKLINYKPNYIPSLFLEEYLLLRF
jgi:hypothetical protein